MGSKPNLSYTGPKKKRESTLPGAGDSPRDKVRRISALHYLRKVLRKEREDRDRDPSSSMPRLFILGGIKLPSVHTLLDDMSTGTLLEMASVFPKSDIQLTYLLERVALSGEWSSVVNFDKQLRGQMLLDVAFFHQHVGDSFHDAAKGASAFREVYDLTGHKHGTLNFLSGHERRVVESLLAVTGSKTRIYVYEQFSFGGQFRAPRISEAISARVIEQPDIAYPLLDYCVERELAVNDFSDADWDGFEEYMKVGGPLRAGTL